MLRMKSVCRLVVLAVVLVLLNPSLANAARVLLLVDSQSADVVALQTALEAAGNTVTQFRPEYQYALVPALSDFDVVVHLDGTTFDRPMPIATQRALVQFVRDGGGFVGAQWLGFEERTGIQREMFDLVLMGYNVGQMNCSTCTLTVEPGQERHPVLSGIPATFTVTGGFWDVSPKDFPVNPPTLLMRIDGANAVLARQVDQGRVVNFTAAVNFSPLLVANPRITQLYVNAVAWVAARANSAPTARIAPPAIVRPGEDIALDGSGSFDPDNNPITYRWTLTPPPESRAVLSDPAAVRPTFTADLPGDYGIQLIVNDGTVDSGPATAIASSRNGAPRANAGPDQVIVLNGTVVQLSGADSSDSDSDPLTYAWTFVSRPPRSKAVLDVPTSVNPKFTADINGTYVATLQVKDPFGATSEGDTVTVSFKNVAPMANAGVDRVASVGSIVVANGSAVDGNGDPLTYRWSLLSVPAGSFAELTGANTLAPSFVANVAGTFVLQLIANDGIVDSVPDTTVVEVIVTDDAATRTIKELIAYINGLPAKDAHGRKVFKSKDARRELVHELMAALRMISQHEFGAARKLLSHGGKRRMDGCTVHGAADRNDLIRTCAEQSPAFALLTKAIGYLAEAPNQHPGRHRHHHHGSHDRDDDRDRDDHRDHRRDHDRGHHSDRDRDDRSDHERGHRSYRDRGQRSDHDRGRH
ncbi:MAG: PKD domain-containing protein [Burkholderiales bacterium]